MRIDPDTCRDPDLLAAEVRRLRGVIAASDPTLTDEEREAIKGAAAAVSAYYGDRRHGDILMGLLERTK